MRLAGVFLGTRGGAAPDVTCHGDISSPLPLLASLDEDVLSSGCITVTVVRFFADVVDTFRVTVFGPKKEVSWKFETPRTRQQPCTSATLPSCYTRTIYIKSLCCIWKRICLNFDLVVNKSCIWKCVCFILRLTVNKSLVNKFNGIKRESMLQFQEHILNSYLKCDIQNANTTMIHYPRLTTTIVRAHLHTGH